MNQRRKKKFNFFSPERLIFNLSIALTIIAFLTTVSLDYLNFKKGQAHYFGWVKKQARLPAPVKPTKPPAEEFSLADYLKSELHKAGIAEGRISMKQGKNGVFEAFLELEEKEFKELKPQLLKSLKKKKVNTRLKETREAEGKILVSVEMKPRQGAGGRLVLKYSTLILVARPSPLPERTAPAAPPIVIARRSLKKVALVIDDMGNDLDFLRELINLKVPLTVAILPDAQHASETAELAQKNGLEVIIHLPLEALNGQVSYTGADGLIRSSMSAEEIRAILEKDFSLLPQAVGLNNHMGSKATTDRYLMDIILDFLKEKNLFFLDSKTTPKSIAYDLAVKKKVPALSRQVFLDADENRRQVKERLDELFRYALKNGQTVGIGHPFPETLEVLKHYRAEAERLGLEPVKLSELLR